MKHVILPLDGGPAERQNSGSDLYGLTIGSPRLNLILLAFHAPPGAPLRNGSIISRISSPGLRDLLDHPSRTKMLGAPPSRFQTVLPSLSLTSRRMKVCGLVYLNSCTVPSSSTGLS